MSFPNQSGGHNGQGQQLNNALAPIYIQIPNQNQPIVMQQPSHSLITGNLNYNIPCYIINHQYVLNSTVRSNNSNTSINYIHINTLQAFYPLRLSRPISNPRLPAPRQPFARPRCKCQYKRVNL